MGMLRVGIVGWRGMVGSVLVQRMREERDFDHLEPVFFSTSQAGGKGPAIGKPTEAVKNATGRRGAEEAPGDHLVPGRRLHERDLPEAAAGGLERLLDRRRERAAHERRRGDHPRPAQHGADQGRDQGGDEKLYRRQLHREPDADGHGGPVPARRGRVDDEHDLPGRLGAGRGGDARPGGADGDDRRSLQATARRPGLGDSRYRPRA